MSFSKLFHTTSLSPPEGLPAETFGPQAGEAYLPAPPSVGTGDGRQGVRVTGRI